MDSLLANPLVQAVVLPLWWPHWLLLRLRNAAYDHRLLPIRRLPAPVIAVGNLSMGGTGKTPTVALLAELVTELGYRPAVISRGYRANADGRNEEAMLTGVATFCHPDRLRAGRQALAAGHDLLIADDLFQHRRLHRDLDLVLIDATRPWGRPDGRRGAVLPRGLLREPMSGLGRSDALLITRSDQVPAQRLTLLRRQCLAFSKPVWSARHRAVQLRAMQGHRSVASKHLAGQTVHLLSGIGNPNAFERSCRDCGMLVRHHHRFPDHHHFNQTDIDGIAGQLDGATVVCTSKDAVKLAALDLPAPARWWILDVRMTLSSADTTALQELLRSRLERWRA
ncbi:MAG: tetraacyldisaccharide 4'-kinase [Planctomycetota bacterium]